jgi:hypothetical protein
VDGKDVGLSDKDLAALRKKYGHDNWYDRNCAVLGTKWDVEGSLVSNHSGKLVYQFESAWAPPSPGIQRISEQYPTLKFTLNYRGEFGEFAGQQVFECGDIVSEAEYDEDSIA